MYTTYMVSRIPNRSVAVMWPCGIAVLLRVSSSAMIEKTRYFIRNKYIHSQNNKNNTNENNIKCYHFNISFSLKIAIIFLFIFINYSLFH